MNIQYSKGYAPFKPVSERKFVSMLKNAYAYVKFHDWLVVYLRNGDKMLMDNPTYSDLHWLNSRRALRGWRTHHLNPHMRHAPNVAHMDDGRVYPSVEEAIADGLIKTDFIEPSMIGYAVKYGNIVYLANNQGDADTAMKELREYHTLIVG